jgi:hypothetical protein
LSSTSTHKVSTVPIHDFIQKDTEPHFADPDILADVHVHLKLRVHDFPGELGSQENVVRQTINETLDLRRATGKKLGIVLICIFDAEETIHGLSSATIEYYNGDLFAKLPSKVSVKEVRIERLVLVFNKYDLLRKKFPNENDDELRKKCIQKHEKIISNLRGICNSEKVCEVFTILSIEDKDNAQGSTVVLGEAARNFVETMVGNQVAQEIIKERATTYSAPLFQ